MYVICCGMYRSGSTWQYLVTSELVERASKGHRIGFVTNDTFLEKIQDLDDSSQTLVLKCHDFHSRYGELMVGHRAKAVYCYRDIREVACSLAWKLALSFDQVIGSAEFRCAIDSYYRWLATPDVLVQRYDTIVSAPDAAVREIASYLSLQIDDVVASEVATKFDLDSNRSRTSHLRESLINEGLDLALPTNAMLLDENTLLHWNHIRPLNTPDWRFFLGPDELERLQPVVQQWLMDAGFERDDTWVAKAISLQDRAEQVEAEGPAIKANAMRTQAEVEWHTTGRTLAEQTVMHRQRVSDLEAELRRCIAQLHVLRDDMRQLRADITDREALIARSRAGEAADRAAVDTLGAELRQARAEMANLTTKRAADQAQLVIATSEVECLRAELSSLRVYANSAGFRLVSRISLGLRRYVRTYITLRWIVRKMA